MNDYDHARQLAAIAAWENAFEKYGQFQIVYESESLENVDPKLIWTESNPGADDIYIINEFLDIEDRNYYIFERPYLESDGEILLFIAISNTCDCEGEDEDCEVCEGQGFYLSQVLSSS